MKCYYNRFFILLDNIYTQFKNTTIIGKGNLSKMHSAVDDVGQEGYSLLFKISIFSCVISFIAIIIARMIFRIASPREDARAKQYIQSVLLIIFFLSMLTTLVQIVINVAGGL